MDNLKTYRMESNGSMTPMVNVWMTADQFAAWTVYEQGKDLQAQVDDLFLPLPPAQPQKLTHRKAGEPHENHANPRRPGVYGNGNFKISAERMNDFLSAYQSTNGDLKATAEAISVKYGTANTYRGIAIKNGLLDEKPGRVYRTKVATTKYPISEKRAREVADWYELYNGDRQSISQAMGIGFSSVPSYISVAKRMGFIDATA